MEGRIDDSTRNNNHNIKYRGVTMRDELKIKQKKNDNNYNIKYRGLTTCY